MVNRRGKRTQVDVEGTLIDVVGRLSRADDGLLNFGHHWRKSVVYIEDVVALEPLEPVLPKAPTKAEILAGLRTP